MEPLDPDVAEMYRMYRYCKLFGATPAEYEQRPHREVSWLLAIDETYTKARNELNGG